MLKLNLIGVTLDFLALIEICKHITFVGTGSSLVVQVRRGVSVCFSFLLICASNQCNGVILLALNL